jgi:hypothetical protein
MGLPLTGSGRVVSIYEFERCAFAKIVVFAKTTLLQRRFATSFESPACHNTIFLTQNKLKFKNSPVIYVCLAAYGRVQTN